MPAIDRATSVSVVIPALNEASTIADVITAIPRDVVDRVVVVDNGSTDETAQVAEAAGATVIHEPRRGYGAACHAGAQAATDADILVFLDGDGADNPREIPLLVDPILAGQADLVIGSRERGEREPGALLPHARFGNWLAAQLMRRLYGLQVTDLGPFRAIRRPVLQALDMQEMTYGWPTEMMVKAAKRGYRVLEVPVSYRRRAGGKSKISGTLRGTVLAAYYILGTTIRYAFGD
ncbi:MAG: putative glycosyltransferase [Anaerolineales bacterium]|nr:putative glycosyltransferase [Anaerolineales bacterium]